jgi:hypothetical protein
MESPEWLLFLPQLPASPSSLRVLVWRRTRAAGALGLQTGAWVLPHTPEQERFLRDLLAEVQRLGGSGSVFVATPLDPGFSQGMVERFRIDRDHEYAEFCERAHALVAELEKESRGEKYTFAELEENEDDLQKLERWLQKIQARDFFGGHQAEAAATAMAACRQALAAFAEIVYQREGLSADGDLPEHETSGEA